MASRRIQRLTSNRLGQKQTKAMDKMPEMAAAYNWTIEELSQELLYLNDPSSKACKDFSKRLANAYAYAFMHRHFELFQWLEARHAEQELADKVINVILN